MRNGLRQRVVEFALRFGIVLFSDKPQWQYWCLVTITTIMLWARRLRRFSLPLRVRQRSVDLRCGLKWDGKGQSASARASTITRRG